MVSERMVPAACLLLSSCSLLFAESSVGTSCRDLQQNHSVNASGLYTIDTDGAGVALPIEVYCEMTTDGGGWTLIGRSVLAAGPASFGWQQATGAVSDDTSPYSLNANRPGFSFEEVLIASYSVGKSIDRAYKRSVPADFLAEYAESTYLEGESVESIVGDCKPDYGPGMLTALGNTKSPNSFLFRDDAPLEQYGLDSGSFSLNYPGCNNEFGCSLGGCIDGEAGMIFVR